MYFAEINFRSLTALSCLAMIGCIGVIHGDDGAWVSANGGDWNTDANWTGVHPDGIDAIAGFVGLPNTANQTITSSSDITLGSLIVNTAQKLTIALGYNLTFSTSVGNAQLFLSGTAIGINPVINTPLILDSSLDIFINDQRQPFINSSISGSGSLYVYGSSNITSEDKLHLSGSNSYTGGTFINTGILELDGADNTTVIPGDISVSLAGGIQHLHNNHYSSTTEMTVNGGFFDLNGTNQSIKKLIVTGGGFIFDGFSSGTLDLLALPGDFALAIGDNAQVNPLQINLVNGGGILYDASHPGTAFIPGITTIDLQGHSIDFNVPHHLSNCIDLDIGLTAFQNGTLNKTGNGVVLFEGGSVPTFNINEGTIVIGDQTDPAVVTATGLVHIFSPGVLGGFQTLAGNVVNSGTISPGSACKDCNIGKLTINGYYAQSSSGTLKIKAVDATTSDVLEVDNGPVILDGSLVFDAQPDADLHVGDRILILDNTTGSASISGTFSSFKASLPPDLNASIIYLPQQVYILISPCCHGHHCTH